jgi:hypothetical protein
LNLCVLKKSVSFFGLWKKAGLCVSKSEQMPGIGSSSSAWSAEEDRDGTKWCPASTTASWDLPFTSFKEGIFAQKDGVGNGQPQRDEFGFDIEIDLSEIARIEEQHARSQAQQLSKNVNIKSSGLDVDLLLTSPFSPDAQPPTSNTKRANVQTGPTWTPEQIMRARRNREFALHTKQMRQRAADKTTATRDTYCGLLRDWPRPRIPCPDCGNMLVLKWGDRKRPHFAHLSSNADGERCGGGESALHYQAKMLVAEYLNNGGCLQIKVSCARCNRQQHHKVRCNGGQKAHVERQLEGGIADVLIVEAGGEAGLAIEVRHSSTTHTAIGERIPGMSWRQ